MEIEKIVIVTTLLFTLFSIPVALGVSGEVEVGVDNPPTASFTHDGPAHTDENVNFDASGSSDDYSISSYEWDWTNDGSYEGSGETTKHSYSDDGTYTIKLRVTDDNGQTDTTTENVTINNRNPTASFTHDGPALVSEDVNFDAGGSSDSDGTVSSYNWDWTNDGSYEGSGETATHSYSDDGTYTVKLQVMDDDFQTDSTTKNVTIYNVPIIENITVDNPLVDRKQDNANTDPVLQTKVTVTVSHGNGTENIDNLKLWIYDSNDGTVVDNITVTDNSVIDENTLEFYYNYDPSNSLSDSQLGGFDVKAKVIDVSNYEDENRENSIFVVDDGTATITIDPNSELGYAKSLTYEASGTLNRVYGSPASGTGTVVDNGGDSATFSGTSYSEDLTINGDRGDNVKVTTYATIDSDLDANTYTTYEVNENQEYTVYLRWEDNYELVPEPIENENIRITFHFEDYTSVTTLENNPENILLQGETTPRKATVSVQGKYRRSRLSFDVGAMTFYLHEPISQLGEYELTLNDMTGKITFPDAYISIMKYHGENKQIIDERFWDGAGNAYPYLKVGGDYFYKVVDKGTGENRTFRTTTFPETLIKTVVIRPLEMPPVEYLYDNVTWNAWRQDDGIHLFYQDNLQKTDNIRFKIFEQGENTPVWDSGSISQNSYSTVWANDNENRAYEVEQTLNHEVHGSCTSRISIGGGKEPLPPPPGIPYTNIGVALASIFGVFMVAITAMMFRSDQPGNAMLGIAVMVSFLSLSGAYLNVQLMPISLSVMVFVWIMAIIFKISEGT